MSSTNTYTEQKYCVYHTTYFGDKLPPNYIGSSTVENIRQGYKGSVKSKKYKEIWENELKINPHLFSIEIISYHETKPAALYKELQIQQLFNVVKNPLFVNMAYAIPNGYFGMDVSGKNNPRYNSKLTNETKLKISNSKIGKTRPPETEQTKFIKTTKKRKNWESLEYRKHFEKSYNVIDPNGNCYVITGLTRFCNLNNLSVSCMSNVCRGERTHHKQWKISKIVSNI